MMVFNYYFIIINLMGFIICFGDKRKAINHKYRIPEKVLLLIIFIGGCFGFTLGMIVFHHKTKKLKFIMSIITAMILWLLLIER